MSPLPIIERAIAHDDRVAIQSANGTFTYRELVDASASVAGELLVGADDLDEARVAFLVPPGERYVQTQWGIWRAGGIAVPLSLSAVKKELEHALLDSQADTVVVANEMAERVAPMCDRHGLRCLLAGDVPGASYLALPDVAPDRRAMILYTSGTTSQPKGVVTTHACIQAQITSLIEAWRWEPDDRIPLFLPLHHIHGIINIMSCALWAGAQIDAFPRFDLTPLLRRVSDGAYTLFMAVPTIYVKLIEALTTLAPDQRDPIVRGFAKMRLMISGSAALPASIHQQWTKLTGQKLLERYGMTEIGMALSNPYEGERRPGAVGTPLHGVEIRLMDETGKSVADEGTPGEILVRGPNVFLEYWNRPDATAASFVDGWFRTGDMAVIDDGYYRIMGRRSVDIIKSGGYKLSALEIEASLLDHPAIRECAVVGLPDETWGERVAAAVVLATGASLDVVALRAWCDDRMSPYKIPRQLLCVKSLPRNAMGKVTKPAVVTLFSASDGTA